MDFRNLPFLFSPLGAIATFFGVVDVIVALLGIGSDFI
jgi:hypothetical protein